MKNTLSSLEAHLHNRRSNVILGLFGLAGVHVMDLPAKWEETFYIAIAYIAVIVFSAVIIERLTVKGSAIDYLGAAGASAAVLLGYVVNRTTGMPGAMDDIGNWFEPLGLLSLAVEIFTLWHSLFALRTIMQIRKLKAFEAIS
ncbi:hypothetical protein [Candidatus Aquiluna sp. UB-MaderosW2red]|uniref:hypothetical protein n=1 Tax=Candidatus Aquiluna sp. UB-MaderosW2red TaxID=1855377 RepID=UPI000875EF53|nr:hypothetical protein [Candidatus Aquiluna sp. UB-MaderosW2red]SCX05501.1 hypothetical protein SAMN05216534_0404 [Candidatus Aquiluna sp. UB-MaderosW2red]